MYPCNIISLFKPKKSLNHDIKTAILVPDQVLPVPCTRYLYEIFFASFHRVIQDNFVKMENMFDLMDEPLEIKDVPNALELVPSNGKIEFKNVSFSYQPERQILKNISFEINAGETIGIVGPTGKKKYSMIPKYRIILNLVYIHKS